jgi:hypothetical protein
MLEILLDLAAECDALSVRYATLLEVCTQKDK